MQVTSTLSLIIDHNKSFENPKTSTQFEHPFRRKSCYCKQCGNQGHFQLQYSNLPTLKEIQFSKQQRIKRKQSFGDEIKTEIPSEFSQIESENGRRIRQTFRSFSIMNIQTQGAQRFEYLGTEKSKKIKRKSCECSECGQLNTFQIKHKELSILKKQRKIKEFQIKRQRQFQKYGSTEFQTSKKFIQKSIITSPHSQSQRSFQVKQINEMRRTKDINKLINNRISTRDLEQPKQNQSKFSIINSCQQLDSPQILQNQIRRQDTLKYSLIQTNIKWKIQ
ncbi:unnamed protein product (macronuclear) [Paramecium tetraurelia]|uniref:CCHC-type domain-containing protein n=1 Tax=Paramecium tetraurelia TaxID=5888 RepID=A0DLD1_PARTE|nr:uncharacterized protein GSPATT00018165001 [Paramecium tetraurelia]CAK83848.1 unnamed protein product [Paramecium tetraurelia]|eukprot:XP_001451245.1 hypothetical protein (macronuclear) [Paramecium tetraurelia strain d4-2]